MTRGRRGERTYPGYNGASEASLRAMDKRARGTAGTAEPEVAPSADAIRAAITAQTCPWCTRGPFMILAGHTHRAHGVSAAELRDLAGLTKTASICAPDHSATVAARGRGRPLPPVAYQRAAEAAPTRKFSAAGRSSQRAKLEAARAVAGGAEELARRGGAAAAARRAEQNAEKYAAIVDAFDEGVLLRDITQHVGVSMNMVRRVLRTNGRRVDGRSRRWTDPAQRQQAASAGLVGGEAVRAAFARDSAELAARFAALGGTYRAVHQMAAERGITTKSMAERLRNAGAPVPDGRRSQRKNR